MKRHGSFNGRYISFLCGVLMAAAATVPMMGQASPAAVAAFDKYTASVEARLDQKHRSPTSFLAPANGISSGNEDFIIEQMKTPTGHNLSGVLLHHWRGTAFIPGANAAEFEQLLKDYNEYPREFSPQVLEAKVLTTHGDHLQAWMRMRQHHVITVTLDATYDVSFGQLDAQHRYSSSRSTQISELDSNGQPVSSKREQGYMWRMNTYWSYEEKDGGLYVQIETVSLTRSIPTGLRWLVGPYVESIPRESMEFTLRSVCNALRTSEDRRRLDERPANGGENQLSERTQG
jgi:hypothetical protein